MVLCVYPMCMCVSLSLDRSRARALSLCLCIPPSIDLWMNRQLTAAQYHKQGVKRRTSSSAPSSQHASATRPHARPPSPHRPCGEHTQYHEPWARQPSRSATSRAARCVAGCGACPLRTCACGRTGARKGCKGAVVSRAASSIGTSRGGPRFGCLLAAAQRRARGPW